jgi:ADP-heptose:LPS heptosyltransferase
LMGDQGDVGLCEAMSAQMTVKPVIAAGKTTLGQSAALMKRSRCVVMNDGGAMHVAAACGVRPIVIFGPVDERVYGPYPVDEQTIVKKNLSCQPCYRDFCVPECRHQSCLTTLTVDEVFKTVEMSL